MPVEYGFVEPGIYRVRWIGIVSIEEPITEMYHLMELVTAQGDTRYVMIVDLTEVTRIPFDLGNLNRVVKQDSRVTAFVVVRAPKMAEIMGNMLNHMSKRPFLFADSLEVAIAMARDLIQNRTPHEA